MIVHRYGTSLESTHRQPVDREAEGGDGKFVSLRLGQW